MRLLLAMVAAVILAACASMGRPEGGPIDETPPRYVTSNPRPGQTNFNNERIVIEFDENLALEDAQNKVIVSPPQAIAPKISALGKRIIVTMRDTMRENTTYTIDFSDAIKDLNEGNVVDGFALDFATGDSIDSLRISGMVLEAATLEPAQGMLVGVYANLSDTALATLPFERVTKTNQLGQFTLRNLRPGSYRIFAINDINRDYKWDRSEDIAFYDYLITPGTEEIMVTDTVQDAQGRDSIFTHPGTKFLPDDVLLTWFNDGYKPQYLVDYKRQERNKLTFTFNTHNDTLPELKLVNSPLAGTGIRDFAVIENSRTNDTITCWLRDSGVIMTDTLLLQARYFKTDSTQNLALTNDTLRFVFKEPKKSKKQLEEEANDTLPKSAKPLSITFTPTQELNLGVSFKVGAPLVSLDSGIFTMDIKKDSLWYPVKPPVFSLADSLNPLNYTSPPYPWKAGESYRLNVDSARITDIYGLVNKPIAQEFTVKKEDEYSAVVFTISPPLNAPAIVELLNTRDTPVKTAPVKDGKATIDFVAPGTYYARLYVDRDSNGTYSQGSIPDSVQPEDTYYYPKRITLKKNWTIEQSWNLDELALNLQKPEAIKKNKPKKKKNETQTKAEDEEEEEDEFFDDPFMRAASGKNFDNTDGMNSNRRRF